MSRAIAHIDLDAFYASAEQLRSPELRGRPVVVGGGRQPDGSPDMRRAVVSAASYEARVFGVHSAMPLTQALRLCPDAVVMPVDFPHYRRLSRQVFDIFGRYTPLVEPLSLDEAFLDLSGSDRSLGPPVEVARAIKHRVRDEVGLVASVGLGSNRTVAKIGSDLEKPDGFVVIPEGAEADFLAPLPLRRLPGLGPASETALSGLGVTTLGDLGRLPLEVVVRRLGRSHGESLWNRARGVDTTGVTPPGEAKSISREETFASDVRTSRELEARIRDLANDVARRLRAQQMVASTVSLKLRLSDFTSLTRQQHLVAPVNDADTVARTAGDLLHRSWSGQPVRLLGVGVSGLGHAHQLDLFSQASPIDPLLDRLRDRFGEGAIRRGPPQTLRDLDSRGEDLRPR